VGRIVPEKGLAWLLRAFAEVSPPAQLEIAGKGPQLEEMKTLARELSVQARVTFHGWVKSSRVSTLIRNARAVVFPSLWHEPAGLVTLEAAAIGRPVIASAVGGIPEYARNDHALLVEPRDLEGMADALSRLARAPDRAADMGRRGFDRAAEDFSMADFLDDLHAFYDCAFETSAEPDPPSTS